MYTFCWKVLFLAEHNTRRRNVKHFGAFPLIKQQVLAYVCRFLVFLMLRLPFCSMCTSIKHMDTHHWPLWSSKKREQSIWQSWTEPAEDFSLRHPGEVQAQQHWFLQRINQLNTSWAALCRQASAVRWTQTFVLRRQASQGYTQQLFWLISAVFWWSLLYGAP